MIEAKAVFSRAAGRYLRGQAPSGTSDIVGCTPHGAGCFIEAKAPGKRSTLSTEQRDFLVAKIERRAFAACVDSCRLLVETYERWLQLPPSMAIAFLLESLPPAPKPRTKRVVFSEQ